MSYSAHRNNRAPMRPRLLANKQPNTTLEGKERGSDSRLGRIRLLSRPVVRESLQRSRIIGSERIAVDPAGDPDMRTADLIDKGEQSREQVQSSAHIWGMLMVLLIVLVWGAGLLIGFQTSLATLLGIGLILAIGGMVSPSLGLLAIGMVAALDAMANIFLLTGGVLRYNTVNYFLLIVILLNIPLALRMRDLSSRMLQIFLLLMALMLTISKDLSSGVQDILNIGTTFGLVIFFARALKDEMAFYWLGIVNGVLTGLGGLVFFLQMNSLPYANPNDWTYFPMTGLFSICIAYLTAIKYNKSRLILLFLAVVNFAWIFLSASRGSLLVALIALAFLFLATRSITWKSVMVVIIVGIGIWVSASFAEQQVTAITRVQELFDPTLSATKRTSKRSDIAEVGLQIFKENPMGIGTGSFIEESAQTGALGRNRPAHSAWIQVLAENGVLGILFMILFVGSYAMVGLRKQSEGKVLFALFITLTLASAFFAKEFRGKSLWFLAASGIVLLHPKAILAYLNDRESKKDYSNASQRIRNVRYGRKR